MFLRMTKEQLAAVDAFMDSPQTCLCGKTIPASIAGMGLLAQPHSDFSSHNKSGMVEIIRLCQDCFTTISKAVQSVRQ